MMLKIELNIKKIEKVHKKIWYNLQRKIKGVS